MPIFKVKLNLYPTYFHIYTNKYEDEFFLFAGSFGFDEAM